MEDLEASGRSVDEAIAQALTRLGLERDAVEVEILHHGRSGILGLGAEEARVRVYPRRAPTPAPQQVAELAGQVLRRLLEAMSIDASIRIASGAGTPDEAPTVSLDIRGDDMGVLIGRRGETLSALQYVVNLILSRRLKTWAAVQIDVEGYRARRAVALERLALRMAERARATGQPVALEPMPAAERRLIHLALRDNAYVVTQSIGDGDDRKVVISPRGRDRGSA